jgi:hypothetical protein
VESFLTGEKKSRTFLWLADEESCCGLFQAKNNPLATKQTTLSLWGLSRLFFSLSSLRCFLDFAQPATVVADKHLEEAEIGFTQSRVLYDESPDIP